MKIKHLLYPNFRIQNLILLGIFSMLLTSACSRDKHSTMFIDMKPSETGIYFENTITTSDSVNAQTDSFIYNGAGVAIGDINNNGLPDIFFSGNMVSSKLYLNLGDFKFEDITESAGLTTSQWITGASMVDINNNGYLDIYLSVSGPEWTTPEERANKLFLNNGDNTFREAASEFNIDDRGFTTHAVFFDYNKNGYLDLFLLGNSPGEFGRGDSGTMTFGARNPNPYGFDQLYKNNGDGTFTNVSEDAGILRRLGYGLGVVVTDINNNGWPDIYVSNDITPNDVFYINNGDGTFTDRAGDWIRHSSFAGMGMDIADITNNGWPDILQTDMDPEELHMRKRVSGSSTLASRDDLLRRGYFPHYNHNVLQYNQGLNDDGDLIFSQISRMAGVSRTDWSWAVIFGDYNNNGLKDLLVTNGYPKAVNDFDYFRLMHAARRLPNREMVQERELEILDQTYAFKVSNYIFQNNGDLTFTDVTNEWGLYYEGFSNGAARADLNNNGSLDLVINNINSPAKIYRNAGPDLDPENEFSERYNFLQINLNGEYPNRRGIGSKIYVYTGDVQQYLYHNPYRGFMSTMDDRAHFGIGDHTMIDSLKIIWPDDRVEVLVDLEANQFLTLNQVDAIEAELELIPPIDKEMRPFGELDSVSIPNYIHRDNFDLIDYSLQPLIPYQISKIGPVIAVADVNGNGFDDLYIGGERNIAGVLYLQQPDGSFQVADIPDFIDDSSHTDWGAHFFDFNGNGYLDLYVASGSYLSTPQSHLLQDRLYLNQGDGRFIRSSNLLPEIMTPTSAIVTGDFTGNGRMDLFVGGRVSPGNYPLPVRSYFLENNGEKFVDVTAEWLPDLIEPGGMITDALSFDYTGNGLPDLITAGEWMEIHLYENNGLEFAKVNHLQNLPPLNGWWFSLQSGDFNGNGLTDFAAGNLGLNYSYKTGESSKFGVYAADFSENGVTDIILTEEVNGIDYPYYGLALLGREMIPVASAFESFESFSTRSIEQIFGTDRVNLSTHYKADTFASAWFENNGNGTFTYHKLPNHAQMSAIHVMQSIDITGNGCEDLILAGNILHTEPNTAPLDAGNGLLLKCDNTGDFTAVPTMESGLFLPGDVRDLVIVKGLQNLLIAGNNSERLQIFRFNN